MNVSKRRCHLTTVFKGTSFEERARQTLRDHLSMSLRRVGGRGDGGIDLQGWWWLPADLLSCELHVAVGGNPDAQKRVPIRILAQCKTEEKKIGPRYIREFEGTIHRFLSRPSTRGSHAVTAQHHAMGPVGVFLSTSTFTTASLRQVYASSLPIALVHLPEDEASPPTPEHGAQAVQKRKPNTFGNILFNPALGAAHGLLRGTVEPRWERSALPGDGRPGLWSAGRRLESWIPGDELDEPGEGARRADPVDGPRI